VSVFSSAVSRDITDQAPLCNVRLVPEDPARPDRLRFRVKGPENSDLRFIPYFEVQEELFEVYPVVESPSPELPSMS